jgi:diguanylate cyclase (GGDEF)-like protein
VNFRDLRSQFTIFIFFPTTDDNTEIKGAFVEAGYDSFVFMDQEQMISRIQEAAPHVVLFSVDALQSSMSEFVEKVLGANSEVQLICVASTAQTETLNEYREYNLAGFVPLGEQLPLRTVWMADQVCEVLYRTYQNEQLLTQSEQSKTEIQQLQNQMQQLEHRRPIEKEVSLSEKMKAYQEAHSKDDYVAFFLKSLPCKAIYFKFLPTVSSFVATFAHGLEIESIKGVGSRLSAEEAKDLLENLNSGKLPQALDELMREGMRVSEYESRVVPVHQALDGLFIFWDGPGFHFEQIENDFLIFHLLYQQAHLLKRTENFDIYDSVTELYNRNFFVKRLEEEIARARRLEKAVSVVRLSVDHLTEIEQSFGRSNRDLILRTIASIVKKTSRINDLSCRTEDNEISLILPHCARKGAALRAERLRRIIEAHAFAINDLKVTVSCGVSEYPSLSTGASDLEVSAGKALEFIMSRGGNKVCLFKPVTEFKPDFEVPPM